MAERIARGLRLVRHHAEARPVLAVGDPADDAIVIAIRDAAVNCAARLRYPVAEA
jgi:hypothetical protein